MQILPTRSCLFVILGGVLLDVGSLFESQVFGVKSYQLCEELSEMNGYAFILFASLNHANLSRLNQWGNHFMTLRRRSRQLVEAIYHAPVSAWRRIELEGVSRLYKTPGILDQRITLPGYKGPLRQLAILDLGHEEPTLLLTNQLRRSPAALIGRYAQRMVIENNIAERITFFHMDALSSAVAMKVKVLVKIASPGPVFSAISGMSRASVPLATEIAKGMFVKAAIFSSSSRISGPRIYCPWSRTFLMRSSSCRS